MEFFVFLIFPVLINVLLIEVIRLGRHKRRLDFLVPEILPSKVLEPRMLFDLCWAILSQPVYWLPLNHLYASLK